VLFMHVTIYFMAKSNHDVRCIDEHAREFDLGDGIEMSMGVGDDVDYYFSNKNSALARGYGLPSLEVEISSTEAENEAVLHLLLEKTRSDS